MTALPDGWTSESLSGVCLAVTKADPVSTGRGQVRYVDIGSVDGVGHSLDEVSWVDSQSAPSRCRQVIAEGDTVFSTVRPYLEKIAFIDGSLHGEFASTGFCVLRPGPRVLPRYLFHYSVSRQMLDQVLIHQRGVSYPAVLDKVVRGATIPLPPIYEQRRIVDILEDHLSRLDAAESGLASSAAKLGSLKERVLARGLLGETLPGPREPSALVDCGTDDGPLADLPLGWTWRRLGEIADVAGGITKDAKRQSDPAFVEVPYLRVANVQRGRLDLGKVTNIRVPASKAQALRLLPGDVLMNEGGDRDKLARGWVWEGQVENCIHQNHVFRARVLDGAIEPKLLSWAANTIGGRWAEQNGKQSVNLASISLTKIRQMPVPVPAAGVQPELVKQLDDQLQACDRLTAALIEAQTRSGVLGRALLAAAFSGQLTGRTSDMEMVEEMAGV